MRPIVEVHPYIIWATIGCGVMFVISVFFLWHTRRSRGGGSLTYWALMMVGFLLLGMFGSYQWYVSANRKPTPAEARAWIKEAEAELKESNARLKAAAEKAHRVSQEAINEMEAERRAKGNGGK